MNPVESAWYWWTHLIDIPFWNPWLAILILLVIVLFILRTVSRMLRP